MNHNRSVNLLRLRGVLILLAFVAGVFGCTPATPEPERPRVFKDGIITGLTSNTASAEKPVKEFLYDVMQDMYFWNTQVPTNLKTNEFASPEALLNRLVVRPDDRFSYIVRDGQGFLSSLQSGAQTAFGFSQKHLSPTDVRFAQVLAPSPASDAGLRRGMRLLAINGAPLPTTPEALRTMIQAAPETSTFQVQDTTGAPRDVVLTRRLVTPRVVLARQVFAVGGRTVGYLLFYQFTSSAIEELNETFAFFRSQGVNEIVLDMRYNPGGLVPVAAHLGSLLASQLAGTVFTQYSFNDRYSASNQRWQFSSPPNALSLRRLFVIMSGSTASASEMIINGLMPHIQVITIGSQSVGKNVGATVLLHNPSGYAIVPVMFAFRNSQNDANFGNGFMPNRPANDDITRDFGDRREECLAAALQMIQTGVLPSVSAKPSATIQAHEQYPLVREHSLLDNLPIIPELPKNWISPQR